MGSFSPLAPLLANWFITSKENIQLKNNVKKKLILQKIHKWHICLYKKDHDLDTFYRKMNTIHPNTQFTLKRPNNNKQRFLDTEKIKIKNQLQTSVCRKQTDIYLILQYTSTSLKAWKLELINFYLNRALKTSSKFLTLKE